MHAHTHKHVCGWLKLSATVGRIALEVSHTHNVMKELLLRFGCITNQSLEDKPKEQPAANIKCSPVMLTGNKMHTEQKVITNIHK